MRFARLPVIAIAALALGALASACAPIRVHRGYFVDPLLADSIQPGVDNRDSVERTLGRPTFVGQFTPDQWYYVSRDTRQLAFATPRPYEQTVLRVSFDPTGNVSAIDKTGVELAKNLSPNSNQTPTRGTSRSFFEDLFGNIGAVGSGAATPPQ